MFCTECGAKVDDGSKFCSSCGKPINAPAVNSSSDSNKASTGTGTIIVERKSKMAGALAFYNVKVDNSKPMPIENGEAYKFNLPFGKHVVEVSSASNKEVVNVDLSEQKATCRIVTEIAMGLWSPKVKITSVSYN